MKFVFFLVLSLIFANSSQAGGPVELHAHLFMNEGMTWIFEGNFFGPLRAETWRSRFASEANPAAMDRSGAAIVVASLYAHPLFSWSLRDSIRRQIQDARKFVSEDPNWVIATDPFQAEKALTQGKHVLILALEGASGILENENDLKEFVDQGGIRIVGPLHLTDDEFGAVAFLQGILSLSNPITWFKDLFSPQYAEGVRINHDGLSERGRWLVGELIKRKVWVDLAHASDHSMNEIIRMLEDAHEPLLYTHSTLRKDLHAERGISNEELAEIKKTGGVLGLMPSELFLPDPPTRPNCPSALSNLVDEYRDAVAVLGNTSVMTGSDWNGGIPHLKPASPECKTGTSLDRDGLWNIGQTTELWKAMKALGAPTPEPLSKMSDHFIEAWKRLY